MTGSTSPLDLAGSLVAEGRRRYDAGDLAEALPLARQAVGLRRSSGAGPAELAEALRLAGELSFELGEYDGARAIAEEALTLDRAAGADGAAQGADLNLLGVCDLVAGDNASAGKLLARSLELSQAALGEDDPKTIEALNNLGVATARSGDMAGAIRIHEDALRRCERSLGVHHRRTAETLNALAVKLNQDPATQDRARELYTRALEAAEASLGPEHPLVATLLANLANARIDADDLVGGRELLERSVALHERRFGPDHPNTAHPLMSLGELELMEGHLETARPLMDRALAIRVKAFGTDHPDTSTSVERLAWVLGNDMQRDADAAADAVAIYQIHVALAGGGGGFGFFKPPGARRDDVDRDLRAYLARVAGSQPPADPVAVAELERAEQLRQAADAHLVGGRLDEAAAGYEAAIEAMEAARGTEHPALVEPLRRLAAIETARERLPQALDLEERAVAILAREYGDSHPHTIMALTMLKLARQQEYGEGAGREVADRMLNAVPEGSEEPAVQFLRRAVELQREQIPDDAVPDPIGLTERRRQAIEATLPLAEPSFTDLPGEEGRELALLMADDGIVVKDATKRLQRMVFDDGGELSDRAAVLVPQLIRIASDPRVRGRVGAAAIATAAVRAARLPDGPQVAAAVLAVEPALRAVLADLAGSDDAETAERAATLRDWLDQDARDVEPGGG